MPFNKVHDTCWGITTVLEDTPRECASWPTWLKKVTVMLSDGIIGIAVKMLVGIALVSKINSHEMLGVKPLRQIKWTECPHHGI